MRPPLSPRGASRTRALARAARAVLAVLALGLLPHCQSERAPQETPAAPAPVAADAPRLSPAFDVGAVVRSVRRRFRATHAGFENGGATFQAAVSSSGRLRLQPHHATPSLKALQAQALELETAEVTLGGRTLAGSARASTEEDGTLVIQRGDVVESLVPGEEGLEQRWTFDQRPEGDGALRVQVAVSGQDFRGASEHGLHFVDPTSGLGVRYGLGTWVDAAGERTPLTPRFEDGRILIEVPAEVVARSRYPAVLDPVLSPEQGLNEPILVPAAYDQETPALATDGTNFLLVWQDFAYGIRAARVRPDGTLVEPDGILVAESLTATMVLPTVAFNGTHYLVVWQERDYRASNNENIVGRRVSRNGALLDSRPFLISSALGDQMRPVVASDGTDFLVVWEDGRASATDIYGTRVLANGTVSTPAGVAYCTATGEQSYPSLAFMGTQYLVAWEDDRSGSSDVYAVRVARTGTRVGAANGFAIASGTLSQWRPAVASDGTRALVAYVEAVNFDVNMRITFVEPDGRVLAPTTIPAHLSNTTSYGVFLEAAFDGTNYLLVYHGYAPSGPTTFDLFVTRVRPNGTLVEPANIPIAPTPGTPVEPAIAATSAGALVAWQSTATFAWDYADIEGVRLNPDGTSPDTAPLLFSQKYNQQYQPAVAFGGTNYLVAWLEERSGNEQLLFTRVTPAGQVLDGEGVRLDTPLCCGFEPTRPAVAFNGSHYLVVWQGYDSRAGDWVVLGVRILPDGTVLDAPERKLATLQSSSLGNSLTVASDGTDFLVVFADGRGADIDDDLYAARILADGSRASDTDIVISTAAEGQEKPVVGFDGQQYVVVWEDRRRGTGTYAELYLRAVTRDGTALPETQLTAAGFSYHPRMASNGQGSLIVWDSSGDVLGRLRDQDGGLGPSRLVIASQPLDQFSADVAFDGTNYVVAWQDGERYADRYEDYNVYLTRVRPDGTRVDDTGVPVATSPFRELGPVIASDGDGGTLIAYVRTDLTNREDPVRVKFRLGVELGVGEACTQAGDCRSGFCVDGVCCESACGGANANDCQACGVSAGASEDGRCTLLPAQRLCRAARSSQCDTEERCDGVSAVCPEDVLADAGTECSDGNACTLGDTCRNGFCAWDTYRSCLPQDSCHSAGTCNPATGACANPTLPDGTWCGDGWCRAGVCATYEPDPFDAGVPDAGMGDGGSGDGGLADAGTEDGGSPDAGAARDGGSTPDAGPSRDAGAAPPPPASTEDGGCGCGTTSAQAPLALAALLWLAARGRSARRSRVQAAR